MFISLTRPGEAKAPLKEKAPAFPTYFPRGATGRSPGQPWEAHPPIHPLPVKNQTKDTLSWGPENQAEHKLEPQRFRNRYSSGGLEGYDETSGQQNTLYVLYVSGHSRWPPLLGQEVTVLASGAGGWEPVSCHNRWRCSVSHSGDPGDSSLSGYLVRRAGRLLPLCTC
ncbi:hypothetical protein HJG60_007758 [Phyllostomus discolor]|uniref:Uncharacterized protein n=1 Tax=Phyllostomus discolor TaxID=89673 RepID=A0A834ERJ1_9CHIR|nr:hypothetical protein HJG60_007758 [Phyllostomus discolor]